MLNDLRNDPEFWAILSDLEGTKGLLRDAWVTYQGEKWHPVLVRDSETKIRGFDLNTSGEWGSKEKVGRTKLVPEVFFTELADESFPPEASIRCKQIDGAQRNGRRLVELKTSARLSKLLDHLRRNKRLVGDSEIRNEDGGYLAKVLDEKTRKRVGYESDPVIRKAIEMHAVDCARSYYLKRGYKVEEFGKPFDLLCIAIGEAIHVEVKGSRNPLSEIIVTSNEVEDARNTSWRSDLFLVDNISLRPDAKGGYETIGGRNRLVRNWVPLEKDLKAIQYRYSLSSDSSCKPNRNPAIRDPEVPEQPDG